MLTSFGSPEDFHSPPPPEVPAGPRQRGAWGRRGWTHLALQPLDLEALQDAISHAGRNVAPKSLTRDSPPAP